MRIRILNQMFRKRLHIFPRDVFKNLICTILRNRIRVSRSRLASPLREGCKSGGAGGRSWERRVKGGFLDAVMAAPRADGTRESTLGRGCQTHAGLSPSCVMLGTSSCPASSFSSPPLPLPSSLSFPLFLLLALYLRTRLYPPPLGSLLARSLAFLLLGETAFFLVAPAMGGNQTSLCPTNEKRSRSNASARVLRQRQPSSSTTHRSCPSLSPSVPLWSLPLLRHSPSPSSHSLSSSHHELRLRFSSRASLLRRISIFFINFSRALQTSLRHPFSNSPSCYIRSDLDLSSLFPVWLFFFACIRCLSHKRPTYLVPPLELLSRSCPCPSARKAFVLHSTETPFLYHHFFFIWIFYYDVI